MQNQYSRKQRKQLELYFRCLSSVCTEGLLNYYYLVYEFHKGERIFRKHAIKSALKQWSITDSTSLKEKIEWLLEDGYCEEYRMIHTRLAPLTRDVRSRYVASSIDEANYAKLAVVNRLITQLPSGNISGFGGGWAIYLCRIGRAYGYLTKEEAWALKIKAAEHLHQAYDNWADYLNAFAAGSHYVAEDHEFKKFRDVYNQAINLNNGWKPIIQSAPWGQHLHPEKDNSHGSRKQQSLSV